ncbi:MAG: PIN domain-containing protein [Gemmataceae bacterium]
MPALRLAGDVVIGGPHFSPGLTAALVLEYESVLKRPGMVPLPTADVDAFLDYLCREGVCRAVRFRLRPAAADPGDDLVLEAAVATGNTLVVTLNPADMRDGAGRFGLELVSPAAAVARLRVPR